MADVTLNQAVQFLTQGVLLLTAILTIAAYVRHRGRERGTIALMFSALGVTTIVSWLDTLNGRQGADDDSTLPTWVTAFSTFAILCHPYLMVRVAQLFRRVPPVISWGTLALMLVSIGLFLPFSLSGLDPPIWVVEAVIAYFAFGELYAMGALVTAARRSKGVAQHRLVFASVGAGLLGLLILVAGITAMVPQAELPTFIGAVLGFLSILAFFLGFSPPQWLVASWRNKVLVRFLQRTQEGSVEQRADQAIANVAEAAMYLTGAETAYAYQPQNGKLEVHRFERTGAPRVTHEDRVDDPLLRPGTEDAPIVVTRATGLGPLAIRAEYASRFDTLIAVPVQAKGQRYALLHILLERAPLFLDETLATLRIIARQAATALELRSLSRDQRLLAAIVETSEDAIISKDPQGRITSWNQGGERLFGYTAQEIIGQHGSVLFGPGQEEAEQALMQRILEGERVAHHETTRVRKDGRVVPVSLTLSPIRDGRGNVVGVSKIARDITAAKEAEAELRKAKEAAEGATRAKSEFLANMSHEIRTPMNAILGMSHLLSDTPLTPEQKEFSDTIRTSSEHLLTIINDILDFSKIESGRLEFERHAFHLTDCIEEAIDLVSARAKEKGLEVAYAVESDVPNWFIGDVSRIRQVLVNLLGNAVKFTEKGGVTLEVGGTRKGQGQFEMLVSVQDTGIGIPPEQRDRLFQSFSQADPSTTRRYGGTGLGLAISRQLVTLMGGRIWFESEVGKGSDFRFTLPLDAAPEPSEHPEGPIRELQGAKCLVVDDNATNIRLLSVLGERWGMVVRSTQDPLAALELAQGPDAFDVALLDHQMPGLDGITLASRLRALPHRKDLPLLLLSSTGYFGPKTAFDRAKFSRVIVKPLRQSQLRDAVLQAINPEHVRLRRNLKPEVTVRAASSLRVLLAEDNATNQLVATRMLRKLGVDPEIVTNGQEAIVALERQTYDLVFMDVHMPVLDGLEATRRICAKWPRHERPRIVAMTAEAMHGDRERCLEAGMDDYVPKPVKMADLERVLNTVRGANGNEKPA